MHYLSSFFFVNQPLHVSGIFEVHHLEVYCIYTTTGTCCAFLLTVWYRRYTVYIHNNWYVLCFSVDCLAQEVYCIYTTAGTCCAFLLTVWHRRYTVYIQQLVRVVLFC